MVECHQMAASDPYPSTSFSPANRREELRQFNEELRRRREQRRTASASNTQQPSQQNANDGNIGNKIIPGTIYLNLKDLKLLRDSTTFGLSKAH